MKMINGREVKSSYANNKHKQQLLSFAPSPKTTNCRESDLESKLRLQSQEVEVLRQRKVVEEEKIKVLEQLTNIERLSGIKRNSSKEKLMQILEAEREKLRADLAELE